MLKFENNDISKTPSWLDAGKLRWAWWCWEPIYAYRRQGSWMGAVAANALWLKDWYDRIHAKETVDVMADCGVNLAVTHFHKGFGLKHEAKEIERTKELVKLCHEREIRVLGYTQFGSIYTETFIDEVPDVEDWLVKDENGKANGYEAVQCECNYRFFPCQNSEAYIKYLKKCLEVGLLEVGLDGVHMDNMGNAPPCHCQTCQRSFREFLNNRYPDEDSRYENFGLRNFNHVNIPIGTKMYEVDLTGPIHREYAKYRVATFAKVGADLKKHVKSLNPEAVILGNPSMPHGKWNRHARYGPFPPTIKQAMHMAFAENGCAPSVAPDGSVISQIHAFKLAEAGEYQVVNTVWYYRDGKIDLPRNRKEILVVLGESAAFGGIPGTNWALRPNGREGGFNIDDPELRKPLSEGLQFLKRHENIYANAESVSNIALLFDDDSILLSPKSYFGSLMPMERILSRKHFFYDIIFPDKLDNLENYELLILPDSICLGKEKLTKIRDFILKGGKMLVLGICGDGDENFRQYRRNPIEELAIEFPENVISIDSFDLPTNGSGFKINAPLPPNTNELTELLSICLRTSNPEIKAPDTTLVSQRKSESGESCFHFVNYDIENELKNVELRIEKSEFTAKEAQFISPEVQEDQVITPKDENECWTYKLPPFNVYGVLVF